MAEKKIKVGETTGRPVLGWVGKKPLEYIKNFPAQLVETFDPTGKKIPLDIPEFDSLDNNWQNLLLHGDNKEVLGYLLANGFRGKIDLIYIDPPFNTGVNYVRQVGLRGMKTEKLEGQDYSLQEQIMYYNSFQDHLFLQSLYERAILLKELLKDSGIIAVRIDYHFSHYLKIILDEIFGKSNFQNELTVNRIKKNVTDKGRRTIPRATDSVFVYFKNSTTQYFDILKKLDETKPGYWHNMESAGLSGPRSLMYNGKKYFPSPGSHFKYPQKLFDDEMVAKGRIRANPKSDVLEYWVEDREAVALDSNWTDIPGYTFTTDYPTENAEKLLERIIKVMSKPDFLVLDCFVGSGTTCAVAQKLGRRWIGVDINKGAIQTTSKRLQKIISEQSTQKKTNNGEKDFDGKQKEDKLCYSFAHYKINDYDLQILRTEAIQLAIQHLGIQKIKTDSFFDGTLGKNLAKIIDFNHPLTLLDLQLIQDELKKRPDENRNVTIACLGKELAVDSWLDEYNKKHPVNKVEVIELRTDKKYGKFLIHKPLEVKLDIKRKDKTAIIEIKDFISPAIIDRLNNEEKIVTLKIDDFRSMIDVVLIDANFNGKVFNITYSDVPKKKSEFVKTIYEIPTNKSKTTIGVKIIDMLGEEILITTEI